jgi:regulator of protease activity HflC (stomatin/prohibitin superfamily)
MERVPFFRRTLWILILGLVVVGLPYALFYVRAAPTSLPGSFLVLVPLLGTITAMSALILSVILVMHVQGARNSLPLLVRTCLITIWLLSHLVYITQDPLYFTFQQIIFDMDLLIMALTASLLVAAQFVLPVESGRDRLLAIRRILGYALGERGPVTFVEEGVARQAFTEDQRPGPGVFLVDNASAVVLRTNTAFTRAVGPGVVFTKPGERCAEALDLRPQVRRVTGFPSNGEDPSDADVTSEAITQDGISISAELSITFILDPGHAGSPRLGRLADKPPYDFNPTSVERAVYAHTFGEFGDVPWTQIPGLLVTDVWREEVKHWSLDSLLSTPIGKAPPLDQICHTLRKRLIPPSPKDFQTSARERVETSRELNILDSRGIRILDITITNLDLPKAIQEQRSLGWRETWAGEVQEALHDAMDKVRLACEKGEQEAEAALIAGLGPTLLEALRVNKRPDRRDTLLALVTDVLHMASSSDSVEIEAHLRSKLATLQTELQDLPSNCQDEQE